MSTNDITNILVCGIGGQGVMTAAEILAEAAMAKGHDLKKTEVAGMAQRGGVVTSHLRFGRKVLSPQIEPGTVQVLLGFEGAEALRWSHYLKPDGLALVNNAQLYGASMFMDMFQDMVNDELTNYLVEGKIDMLGQPVPSENQQKYTFNVDKPEDVYTLKYEIGFVPEFQIQGLDATDHYERYKLSDLDEISEKEMKNIEESNGERTDAADSILEGDIVYVQATELDGDALKPNVGHPGLLLP